MKIVSLVENTKYNELVDCIHGLSLYVETKRHKILFDVGPDDLFLQNAKKLNVDISKVDTVIISHGHSDHGGGLNCFLKNNSIAKIYIRRNAFGEYYSLANGFEKYIGLDKSLKDNERFIFTDNELKIDDELYLFSNITEKRFISSAGNTLMMKENLKFVQDNFLHEQILVISENNKNYMFTGCSHNGIINILSKYKEKVGGNPLFCFGGFHLYNPSLKKYAGDELITGIADELKKYDCTFYTMHCTGAEAYLKIKLNAKNVKYLSCGERITV